MTLEKQIEQIYSSSEYRSSYLEIFKIFLEKLDSGEIRAAEKIKGEWQINDWVKKGIILGFRFGKITKMGNFIDKDTFPQKQLTPQKKVRLVPGGSSIRIGSHIGKNVILMPPMFVNVGAFIGENSMIDSHALVGTCAQIGKNVHLSAASQIGGVLEPIGAKPVIIEDDVFIGGNCGIYEGVIIQKKAILAAGVIITAGTPVFNAVKNEFLSQKNGIIIPENAVVVPGSRPLQSNPKFSVYCPIIIKYRDEKTESSVVLENALR